MTNFTIKNNVKAENAKLVDATAYQDENGTWYIELLYEYEDEFGVHRRYYPKVEFPFFCGKLPPEEDAGGCKHIGRNCAYCRREFWAHEL